MPAKPAARLGDRVTGSDLHIVLVPAPPGPPVPTPMTFPVNAVVTGGCCVSVLIGGRPAATVGSTATLVPHVPPPGSVFQVPPTHTGTVQAGSAGVLIGGRAAARTGDPVQTCSDPLPQPNGRIVPTAPAPRVLVG